MTSLRILVGIRSNLHDLEAYLMISLRTSFSVVDGKQCKGDSQHSMSVLKASFPNTSFKIAINYVIFYMLHITAKQI